MTATRGKGRGFEGAIREFVAATRAYQKAVKKFEADARALGQSGAKVSGARTRLERAVAAYDGHLAEVEALRAHAIRVAGSATLRQPSMPVRGIRLRQEGEGS